MSKSLSYEGTQKYLEKNGFHNGIIKLVREDVSPDLTAIVESFINESQPLDVFFENEKTNEILLEILSTDLLSDNINADVTAKEIYKEIFDVINDDGINISEEFFKELLDCYSIYVDSKQPEEMDMDITLEILDCGFDKGFQMERAFHLVTELFENYKEENINKLGEKYIRLTRYSISSGLQFSKKLFNSINEAITEMKDQEIKSTLLTAFLEYNNEYADESYDGIFELDESFYNAIERRDYIILSRFLDYYNVLPEENESLGEIIKIYKDISLGEQAVLLPSILKYTIHRLDKNENIEEAENAEDTEEVEEFSYDVEKVEALFWDMLNKFDDVPIEMEGFKLNNTLVEFASYMHIDIGHEACKGLENRFNNSVFDNNTYPWEIDFVGSFMEYSDGHKYIPKLDFLRRVLTRFDTYVQYNVENTAPKILYFLIKNLNEHNYKLNKDDINKYKYALLQYSGSIDFEDFENISGTFIELIKNTNVPPTSSLPDEIVEGSLKYLDGIKSSDEYEKQKYNEMEKQTVFLLLKYISQDDNLFSVSEDFIAEYQKHAQNCPIIC